MPGTLAFETFLASKIRTSFRSCKNCKRRRPSASRLFVRGIAQAIAVHLARNYATLTEALRGETSSLPGFKLRRITDWMAEHMVEEFSLTRLAEQAGMSEFHFNRLFKRARYWCGDSPTNE